jgi:2-polyprenyl-6-methoxyphenol hydroxylase-like FAD-dependent oxidoreductase
MTKESRVPILIVGGGAAGTMLMLELARSAVSVRTIDRLDHPATTSRATFIHARTAELLERIDKRLVDRFLDRGIRNGGYSVHRVGANGARDVVDAGVEFASLDSRYPYILVHRQNETEQYLREYASAHYGRWTEWSTECVAVAQDEEGVTATLRHLDSDTEEIVHCRYLVGCDGAGSAVRRALGLDEAPHDDPGAALHTVDAYLDDFPGDEDRVHYCVGAGYGVAIVRLPGGFHRIEGPASAAAGAPAEQGLMRLVAEHFDGVALGRVVARAEWRADGPGARAYRHGNVLLVGGAAHGGAGPGGQDLNRCMQDACNLAWRLALVTHGHARPSLLDGYEAERRPVAERAIATAAALADALHGRSDACDPRSLRAIAEHCSGLAVTYRDRSDALAPLAGPAVGDRAPDAELGGGRALYDFTRHPRFTLLALRAGDDGSAQLATALRRLVGSRYEKVLEAHVVPPSPGVARHYGADPRDRLYLLRPDGHVAFRCLASEMPALAAHLEDLFTL